MHARTSYKPQEIGVGEKFVNIYNPVREDGTVSIDVRKLGETEPAELSESWEGTQTFHHTMAFSAFAPSKIRENLANRIPVPNASIRRPVSDSTVTMTFGQKPFGWMLP